MWEEGPCISPTIHCSPRTCSLIITAAPFGPEWLPGDADIPVTWDEQIQRAVDCYNAGATMLHVHVRDPKRAQGSANFDEYNDFIGRLRQAVPKMILQVGGSISFAPHTAEAKVKWLDYDTRHMLTELNPKPDCVTVTPGTTLWNVTMAFVPGDVEGTHLDNPEVQAAWSGMVVDSAPAFHVEHPKRLRKNRIQPYFVRGHVHQIEIIERLIRTGVYMGPMNVALCGYGGGSLGRNPFDWMEMIRRTPHGASTVTLWSRAGQFPGDQDSGASRRRPASLATWRKSRSRVTSSISWSRHDWAMRASASRALRSCRSSPARSSLSAPSTLRSHRVGAAGQTAS